MAIKTTHIVVQGDTLRSIAQTYKTTVESIKELNNLTSDKIVVGQVLTISGEREEVKEDNFVTVKSFGLLAGTTRTVLLTWSWSKLSQTTDYTVRWEYRIRGTNDWRFGQEGTVGANNIFEATYNADENAEAVRAWVKPVPSDEKYNFLSTAWQYYNFANNPPATPSAAPSVSITKQTLTVSLSNIDLYETGSYTGTNKNKKRKIEFWIIKDDGTFDDNNPKPFKIEYVTLISNRASLVTKVDAGYEYYVRYRAWLADQPGGWSPDSDPVASLPTVPEITQVNVVSDTAIEVTWKKVNNAKSYIIEYASVLSVTQSGLSKESYFNAGQAVKTQVSVEEDVIEKDGLTTQIGIVDISGSNYYIRICSTNSKGDKSEWSKIEMFSVGVKPSSPTTWSSTISSVIGDSLFLYWIHNATDSSISNYSKLHLKIMQADYVFRDVTFNITTVSNDLSNPQHQEYVGYLDGEWLIKVNKSDPEEKTDNTYVCEMNTLHNTFEAGYKIEWEVCTAGVKVVNGVRIYGDYSATKKVDIYMPPSFSSMNIENSDGETIGTSIKPLMSFPLYVRATVAMTTNQKPITYFINVIAQEGYTTIDTLGNTKKISEGSSVYSKHIDISDNTIEEQLDASNIDLENGITYKVVCTVSMSSGLKATDAREFKVAWIEKIPIPDAYVVINTEDISAEITPYVSSRVEDDMLLSVYRREYDGRFIEITSDQMSGETVTDPHPSLDYARYRIVAKQISTGGISYFDMPSYPINEKSVVIQWSEPWQYLDKESYEIEDDRHSRAESILKLKYNIKVSNKHNPDVSLINYIGRERSVSYYGTHLGESSTWSVAIPNDDVDTLYAIRRLARWMGDVYVREPSGVGYWANIKVTYNQSYDDLTIPITFNITPVEGGM